MARVWRAERRGWVSVGGRGMEGGRRVVVDQVERMVGTRDWGGGGVDIFCGL